MHELDVRRCRARTAIAAVSLALVTALSPGLGHASTPSSGAISPLGGQIEWVGTALGSGSADESTCVEGVNCDTFTLTVLGTASQWTGKSITIDIGWQNLVNDYDLYIRKDSITGASIAVSGGGAPQNNEAAAIVPSVTGTGTYTIRIVYFLVTPQVDQYRGKATVGSNSAVYLKGGLGFGPNHALTCPVAGRDGEPSSRCDKFGNYYISGIRGVPAGCDLWYFDLRPDSPTFDPFMRNAIYRGQPDSFTQDEAFSVGADGGGDVDLAVGFGPDDESGVPTLAFTSLVAANISTAISKDLGQTWTLNPFGNATGGVPVDDRQWIEFYGKDVVYLLYRTFQPAVTQIQRSNDGGLTFGAARTVGQLGQVGSIDVDPNDGTVYVAGSRGMVGVGIPATPGAEPLVYTAYAVAEDIVGGVANIFFVVRVADDGTVYACYSNGTNVYLKRSSDKGRNWGPAIRVNDGPETRTALLPWLETGPTPGSVAVVWYGTSANGNTADADWNVFMSQSLNANSTVPTFRQVQVSDHPIHAGIISTGGTLGDQNRNLLDYFQVVFDPQGAAVVGWTDDHNDADGHTYVSRQVSGIAADGKKMKKQREGNQLSAATSSSNHVTDFENDVEVGLLVVGPQAPFVDIREINFGSEVDAAGDLFVTATMRLTSLAQAQPQTAWRMSFTANAPYAGLNATGAYSNALSDRGTMFFLRATNGAAGVNADWGTAVRNADGTLTYTSQGPAEGVLDMASNTVKVRIRASALNAIITNGPPLASGSVLAGLRGTASGPVNGNVASDGTRGGKEYRIP